LKTRLAGAHSIIMVGAVRSCVVAALGLAAAGCSGPPLVRGTGSSPGTGGLPGAGGPAGTGGVAGTGGLDLALCTQVATAYADALTAALACTPGAPDQCQIVVGLTPSFCPPCGNQEYVNDATQVNAVLETWMASCAPPPPAGCGLGPCTPPTLHASCWPTSPGATTGTCVPYGPDAGAEYVPDGGESCDQLAADWAAAAQAARACTPGAPDQCQQFVSATAVPSRDECNCPTSWVFVNDKSLLQDAARKWDLQCTQPCAGGLCGVPTPSTGVCVPVDGGSSPAGGICVPRTADAGP
jgi:hypothetical protein